jgi:hypothetical protein
MEGAAHLRGSLGGGPAEREGLGSDADEEGEDDCLITGEAGASNNWQNMAHPRHLCRKHPLKNDEGVGLANAAVCEHCWCVVRHLLLPPQQQQKPKKQTWGKTSLEKEPSQTRLLSSSSSHPPY